MIDPNAMINARLLAKILYRNQIKQPAGVADESAANVSLSDVIKYEDYYGINKRKILDWLEQYTLAALSGSIETVEHLLPHASRAYDYMKFVYPLERLIAWSQVVKSPASRKAAAELFKNIGIVQPIQHHNYMPIVRRLLAELVPMLQAPYIAPYDMHGITVRLLSHAMAFGTTEIFEELVVAMRHLPGKIYHGHVEQMVRNMTCGDKLALLLTYGSDPETLIFHMGQELLGYVDRNPKLLTRLQGARPYWHIINPRQLIALVTPFVLKDPGSIVAEYAAPTLEEHALWTRVMAIRPLTGPDVWGDDFSLNGPLLGEQLLGVMRHSAAG